MIKIEDILKVLNDAVKKDPKAMADLIAARVPCNEAMADHETIQVQQDKETKEFRVGALGLLNGILGVDEKGYGPFAAEYDDASDKLIRFKVVEHKDD